MRAYLLTLIISAGMLVGSAHADIVEPGGTAEAGQIAITNPDEYAWQLFLYINRQARPGLAGVADDTKKSLAQYDDDRDLVWETWALSSGLDFAPAKPGQPLQIAVNKSEVFKNPATQPVQWEKLPRAAQPKILSPNFKTLAVMLSAMPAKPIGGFHILVAPGGTNPAKDESRMNKSTYETVRSNRLYSVEGIDAAIDRASKAGTSSLVKFDPMSKEVKARWKHLKACDTDPNCADKRRYHWRTVDLLGKKEIWALVSLHVITKDLPSWFWADFGHIDCEDQKAACADEEEKHLTPLRDSTTGTPSASQGPSGKDGVRNETVGSKWQYYRLRGTEIDFVTPTGIDNILSNPVIESGFQRSSCMTCHAYASGALSSSDISNQGSSLPLFAGKKGVRNAGSQSFEIGRPLCQRFYTQNLGGVPPANCPDPTDTSARAPIYYQTDFLWSIPFRAFSETP